MTQGKRQAIDELLHADIKTREELYAAKRRAAKKYKVALPQNSEILEAFASDRKGASEVFRRLLRKRAVRTLSGIAPVAVLTKPWPCPGRCAYCPTEKDVPQSYLSNEPAVMRAIREGYDPYDQVQSRLAALEANGHEPTKIEIIVIGGTWSVLPGNYKFWYIKECFRASNNYQVKSSKLKVQSYSPKLKINKLKKQLQTEQKRNERAKYKIIGLTLETRPDYINEKELLEMRELGCTRVELGVQAIDDKILEKNRRGHGVEAIVRATASLKNFGFKVTYHIMPGLPGSTPAKDLRMYERLFSDERFQPDQIKFYPTVVTRGSLLYRWWKQGKYKPYSQQVLENLIMRCKAATPNYVRIIRLIRDIPGESIVAGNLVTNLRQVMQQRGVACNCIRCREVKDGKINNYQLRITNYHASDGDEYFIEAISKDGKILYGFCRLRLSSHNMEHVTHNTLGGTAIIRELHVYGELVSIGKKKIIQHAGLGKRLMLEAEKIVRKNGFKKIAVIAGIGARGYYRKLGYGLKDTYMIKR
jgi:elongator complex protein 3